MPDFVADASFFSHTRDQVPARSGAVSKRSPVAASRGGWCGRKTSSPDTFATGLVTTAPSNSLRSNQVLRANDPENAATIPHIPRSKSEAVQDAHRQAETLDRHPCDTARSNDRCWGDSPANNGQSPLRIVLDRIPTEPACDDRPERLPPFSIAVPTAVVAAWTRRRWP
jgi:hypothetical protein